MQEKIIYCNYNLFDLHQGIYIHDPKEPGVVTKVAITTLDNLGYTIAEMCDKYDIYKVRLFGSQAHAESIVDDIQTYALNKYSNKNAIEIEVN